MTDADVRPMRTATISLCRKLGEGTENPACTFARLRVGYRMPKGERGMWGPEDSPRAKRTASQAVFYRVRQSDSCQ